MTKLHELAKLGQSIWLDDMRRSFIESGKLATWIDRGLRGETSNPSIFDKAIADHDDYDDQLRELAEEGLSVHEIYERLTVEDVQRAADEFRPLYEKSGGQDGFVSLEVNPELAHKTDETIKEVHRLWDLVDRPNVMIKVPATPQGIPAVRQLISDGLNINITLMFSLDQYDAVADAYISGLEKLIERGGDPSHIHSVASFFISRIDVEVDRRLDDLDNEEVRGKIGIANAKMAYQSFQAAFGDVRWARLEKLGANLQRVLWASTSVKDSAYPQTMYVDNLIGPHTVNTLPLSTIKAFLDHGTAAYSLGRELDRAQAQLDRLAELGIDLDEVTDLLLEEGVEKFADSFDSLLDSISDKRDRLMAGTRQHEAA
jgi:transaldolase